ncbi:MAG: hypothetical protein KatS3mg008_0540 [Acidimicrobiales bacterium]|nr:MAG: hypothetical protein KatS3mg008_0540 [Acidimicrobiales bacterium]
MVLPVLRKLSNAAFLRRALLVAAAFAAVNMIFYPIARAMGEPLVHYNWIAQDKIAQLDRIAASGRCIEVLIQGNSLAAGSVDPARLVARFGGRAYNAGLWGTQLHHDAEWLERFVLPRLNPKVVVLVVSPLSMSDTSAIAREVNDKWERSPATRVDIWSKLDGVLRQLVPVARYRDVLADPGRWRDLLGGEPDEEDRRDPLLRRMTESGYIPVDRVVDVTSQQGEDLKNFARKLWLRGWRLSESEVRSLEDVALLVHDSGGALLVVLVPTSPVLRDLLPGGKGAFEKYRDRVVHAASRHADEVIDLSDLAIPTPWYYDHIHLNDRAARMFTDALAPAIAPLHEPCGED